MGGGVRVLVSCTSEGGGGEGGGVEYFVTSRPYICAIDKKNKIKVSPLSFYSDESQLMTFRHPERPRLTQSQYCWSTYRGLAAQYKLRSYDMIHMTAKSGPALLLSPSLSHHRKHRNRRLHHTEGHGIKMPATHVRGGTMRA